MPLNLQDFTVHDVSHFPIVHLRPGAAQPGYAEPWEKEMNILLTSDTPFVVIFPANGTEETHEDRKRRGIWLKKNKKALGRACLSLITIEPDSFKRVALKAQALMAVKAFGVPIEVFTTPEEASSRAKLLITTAIERGPTSGGEPKS